MTQDHHAEFEQAPPGEHDGSSAPATDSSRQSDVEPSSSDGLRHCQETLGADPSVRDVARAAKAAFLSPDLLQSGPTLWPFGRRARDRRDHNRTVAVEAQRRRGELHTAFAAQFATHGSGEGEPARRGPVSDRARRIAILALVGMVVAVAFAAWVWSGPAPNSAAPTTSPPPSTMSSSTPNGSTSTGSDLSTVTLPALPPIPSGGVVPITPRPGVPLDPGSVRVVEPPRGDPTTAELVSPEAAMRAWLARLCPFDHGEEFGAAQQRARPAMTDAGWSILNPFDGDPRDQRARASWDKTQAAGESGRCSDPTALVSPQAPRSPTSAIVIGEATRVITAPGQPAYAEPLSMVWRVRQGADGLWRLDVPADGG